MKPVLFTIPWIDLPVYGYGVMLGLAFIVGWYFIPFTAKRHGLNPENYVLPIILAAFLSLVGARLFHVISNPHLDWTFARIVNVREGGMVAYGGFIFGVGTGLAIFIYRKLPIRPHLDAATPALALGLGLTRLGCFLRGCCYGVRTDSFLGLSFPPPSLVAQQHSHRHWALLPDGFSTPVLPTQLFESAAGFVLAGFTWWLLTQIRLHRVFTGQPTTKTRHLWRDGLAFWAFVGLYSFFRFLIEFVRDDGGRGTVGLLSTSQFIGIFLVAGAAFMVFYWLPRHPLLWPDPNATPSHNRSRSSKPSRKPKKSRNR